MSDPVYTEHFGFSQKPFTTTPDPRVFYANALYREAYATVLYGVREQKGIVLLTGEVGTGKTTVLRRAVAELEPAVRCVLFSSPMPGFDDVLGMVCDELRLTGAETSSVGRLRRLHAWLGAEAAEGRTAAVLVDEAQNLNDVALEQLRLLSNLETPGRKLLQIVLVGQPELEVTLDRHELRQLRQRIGLRCRLERLTTDREVAAFIDYRLKAAGYRGGPLFPPDTIALVARYSTGLPRLINVVCDNALLATFATGGTRVAPDTIHEVARDLRLDPPPSVAEPRPVPAAAPVAPAPPPERAEVRLLAPRPTPAHAAAAAPGAGRDGGSRGSRAIWVAGGLVLGLLGAAIGAAVSVTDVADVLRVEPALRAVRALGERAAILPAAARPAAVVVPSPTAAGAVAAGRVRPEAPTELAVVPPAAEGGRAGEPVAGPEPAASVATEPPADDDRRRAGRARVLIRRGATVAELVQEHYGDDDSLLAMDLVHELNDAIVDVDTIRAGDRIWLPPLADEVLVRAQDDGTYRVIVASVRDDGEARRLARALQARGYAVAISRRALSRTLRVSRVEIVGLPDRRAAARAAGMRPVIASMTLNDEGAR